MNPTTNQPDHNPTNSRRARKMAGDACSVAAGSFYRPHPTGGLGLLVCPFQQPVISHPGGLRCAGVVCHPPLPNIQPHCSTSHNKESRETAEHSIGESAQWCLAICSARLPLSPPTGHGTTVNSGVIGHRNPAPLLPGFGGEG